MGENSISRRNFLTRTIAGATAISLGLPYKGSKAVDQTAKKHQFKLKYAPHFGMFKHHAGEDLIDQIKFMAEVGFTAMEDNGMKDRSIETQEKIAKEMTRLGMTMGVFVAHKIYWSEPNLTSGKKDLQEEFLTHIKESVEVAKRVKQAEKDRIILKYKTVINWDRVENEQVASDLAPCLESRAGDVAEPVYVVGGEVMEIVALYEELRRGCDFKDVYCGGEG